jgi:predicted TIM-barrel fold metal-dependent hydrolase
MTPVVGERSDRTSETALSDRPYLIVSGDSHAGPSLEKQLRRYCPKKYTEKFEEFVNLVHDGQVREFPSIPTSAATDSSPMSVEIRQSGLELLQRVKTNTGSMEPDARLSDMDADGITSELIFAGGMNGEVLPWAGAFDAGSTDFDSELRALGGHMWNEWLADFCATAPERLLGVAQIPIWDIAAAIKEVRWAKDHGLRAINFPAPRRDYPAYNEMGVYEAFWSVVEEVELPLVTHAASGEAGSDKGQGAAMLFLSELFWLSRRGLGQLIFGGVFDRHPSIRVAFVEQRGNWVQHTLNELDSSYLGAPINSAMPLLGLPLHGPKHRPSEYWTTNCFIVDSFMAPFEAAMREEIGLETLMWGSDYPHLEGTWPFTRLSLRNTFAGVPENEVRTILGHNGARLFNLDLNILEPVAERIGPKPVDLATPLTPEEFPPYPGQAFREVGSYH